MIEPRRHGCPHERKAESARSEQCPLPDATGHDDLRPLTCQQIAANRCHLASAVREEL